MNCKVKSNILVNAQKALGGYSVSEIQRNTLDSTQLIEHVRDTNDIIGEDNFDEKVADRNLMASALGRIKKLKDFGFIVSNKQDILHRAAARFFNNIVRHKDQAMDVINKLNTEGYITGEIRDTLQKVDGKYTTTYNVEHINKRVQKLLGRRLVVQEDFITKNKDGSVEISQKFLDMYNDYRYEEYIEKIALVAGEAVRRDDTTTDAYKEGISYLRIQPLHAHIDEHIEATRSKQRKLRNEIGYDPSEIQRLQKIIDDEKERKRKLGKELTVEALYAEFTDRLDEMEAKLRPEDTSYTPHFTLETLLTFKRTLDMIESAAQTNHLENSILDYGDLQLKELRNDMQAFWSRAKDFKVDIDEYIFSTLKEAMESYHGRDLSNDEIKRIKRLNVANAVLGPEHINNPLISYMTQLIDKGEGLANIKMRKQNDEIEKLFKTLSNTGFDMTKFYQKDADGRSIGRLVDVFSSSWWKDLNNFKGKHAKNRNRYTVALNPVLLHSPNNSREKEEGKKLRKYVLDRMGKYMGEMYLKESERLWVQYNASLRIFKTTVTGHPIEKERKIEAWKLRNSPIERIKHINSASKHISKGSDTYLLIIPKKIDSSGYDTGYYDNNFQDVLSNKKALDFYKEVRRVFRQNQEVLERYEEKLKPPTLAYIGKSVSELVHQGDYWSALKLFGQELKQEYSFRENVTTKDFKRDPLNWRVKPELTMEIHSIPEEIWRRVTALMNTDEYKEAELEDQVLLKMKYQKEATEAVEQERSNDLLQSITMANYAVHSFVQKKAIETEITLGKYILDTKVLSEDSNKDIGDKSLRLAKSTVDHFLSYNFYNTSDLEMPDYLEDLDEDEKQDPNKKVTTTRGLANVLATAGRVLVLGWSFPHAILNGGQHYFSSIMKAMEDGTFSLATLHESYASIVTNKKDRTLVDRLFVVGDVAYSYKKRTIYEQNKLVTWLHPMHFQTMIERFNQGSTAIAILKSEMVTDTETNEQVSVYEALNEEGDLAEHFKHERFNGRGDALMAEITVRKIRPIVKQVAGDYLSPLLAEKNPWGKLALMFKKWMPELVYDRVHKRRFDEALNQEKVGRLRALVAASSKALTGKWSDVDQVEYNAAVAGLKEVVLAMALRSLFLLSGKLMCDTPECKEQKGATLFAINMLGRLSDDVLTFLSPRAMMDIALNPFAVEGTINDYTKFLNDLSSWILPGGDTGRYKRRTEDYDKGDLKWVSKSKKLLPVYKTWGYNIDKFSKKLNYDPTMYGFIQHGERNRYTNSTE